MPGMDDYLVRVLKLAQEDPRYQQLAEYLVSRRAMPEMSTRYLGSTSGDFEDRGAGSGKLRLNSELTNNPSAAVKTLSHEMTHASMAQMGRQWYDLYKKPNKTPEEQRFVDNYEKVLSGTKNSGLLTQMQAFDPEWYQKNTGYRSSYAEAPAFAIGDLKKNYSAHNAPLHMDPSIATQYMQLLDQAQKLQSATYNQSQGR